MSLLHDAPRIGAIRYVREVPPDRMRGAALSAHNLLRRSQAPHYEMSTPRASLEHGGVSGTIVSNHTLQDSWR